MEREGRSTPRGERGRSPSLPRRSSTPPPRRSSSPPQTAPPQTAPPQTAPRSSTPEETPQERAAREYFDGVFGPSPNRTPPVSSAAAYFDSVFGPSSTGRLRDRHTPVNQAGTSRPEENHDYIRTITPWPYDSSIYYGGQDIIVFPNKNKKPPPRSED